MTTPCFYSSIITAEKDVCVHLGCLSFHCKLYHFIEMMRVKMTRKRKNNSHEAAAETLPAELWNYI